ncbi:hypothetical protein CesoFtcFv8_004529 [Champsocephalus esox]|uniref:Uncharacterized protein n=1 Tax=Champsocephalus esox TaxID=159716 RepID=A0AAN8CMM5_9TELE|nr:hypothetical protein CesoFtcFv8_004529 [Champsocephalus esox]
MLFSTSSNRFSLSSVLQKGEPEGMNINWSPVERLQLRWCSQCVSHSVQQQPLKALGSYIETAWLEVVAGAQDKFCMHIFTYMFPYES